MSCGQNAGSNSGGNQSVSFGQQVENLIEGKKSITPLEALHGLASLVAVIWFIMNFKR
jgi:small-conductance mechanosensitive channel